MPQLGDFAVGTLNLSEIVGQKTEALEKSRSRALLAGQGWQSCPGNRELGEVVRATAQEEEGPRQRQCGL